MKFFVFIFLSIQISSYSQSNDCRWSSNKEFGQIPFSNSCFVGVPSLFLTKIFWDQQDHLYIATSRGLAISKDKGKTFVTKTPSDGLAGLKPLDLYVDKKGVIYVAFRDGLSISKDGGKSFLTNRSLKRITSIDYCEETKTLYVASYEKGLYISQDQGKSFKRKKIYIKPSLRLSFKGKLKISQVIANGDNIYIALKDSILISKNKGKLFKRIFFAEPFGILERSYVVSIAVNSEGLIFVELPSRIAISEDKKGNSFVYRSKYSDLGLSNTPIQTSNGSLYINHGDYFSFGIDSEKKFIKNNKGEALFNKDDFFSIFDISTDKSGDIYLGSNKGLLKSKDQGSSFELLTKKSNYKALTSGYISDLRALAINLNQNIFLGSDKGFYLSKDNGINFEHIRLPAKGRDLIDTGQYIVDIKTDNRNRVYIASHENLYISDDLGETLKAILPRGNSFEIIRHLGVEDNFVYLAGDREIYISNNRAKSFTKRVLPKGLRINNLVVDDKVIYILAKNEKKNEFSLIISSDNAVSLKEVLKFQNDSYQKLPIFIDGNKTIYVGSKNNLYISSNSGKSFSFRSVFPNLNTKTLGSYESIINEITSLVVDSNGRIFIGSDKQGLAISDDNAKNFKFKTVLDGLGADEIRELVLTDKKLLVLTNLGLSYMEL